VEEVVTIDAVRTPAGQLQVDDILAGCGQQVGVQSGNIARTASLGAGFPEPDPAATIKRQCGSSQ
jgi:acetyl-CoA acetyltransferase